MQTALKCAAELSIDEAIREARKLGASSEIINAVDLLERARVIVAEAVTAARSANGIDAMLPFDLQVVTLGALDARLVNGG